MLGLCALNLLLLLIGRLGSKILHWRGAKERKRFFGKARDLSLLSSPPLGLSSRHDFWAFWAFLPFLSNDETHGSIAFQVSRSWSPGHLQIDKPGTQKIPNRQQGLSESWLYHYVQPCDTVCKQPVFDLGFYQLVVKSPKVDNFALGDWIMDHLDSLQVLGPVAQERVRSLVTPDCPVW